MDEENEGVDLSYPGACEGLKFNVRGDKQTSPRAAAWMKKVLASSPAPTWETREKVLKACQIMTTSGTVLDEADANFIAAVLYQIASGLRPTDVFKKFGLTFPNFRRLISRDTRLEVLYNLAVEMCRESREVMLEDEALRRAIEGADVPVYYKGKLVDTKKEPSDTLLLAMLKAHAPDRYADRTQVSNTGTVLQIHIDGVRSHGTPTPPPEEKALDADFEEVQVGEDPIIGETNDDTATDPNEPASEGLKVESGEPGA